MKTLMLPLLLVLPLLVSCASTKKETSIRQEIALWTEDVATLTLIAKPEYRRRMEAAVRALDAAEASGGINIGAITSALLKVNTLQSRDSRLALVGGRLILRRALGDISVETPEQLNQAGLGIRDGLKAALAAL